MSVPIRGEPDGENGASDFYEFNIVLIIATVLLDHSVQLYKVVTHVDAEKQQDFRKYSGTSGIRPSNIWEKGVK